MWDACLGLSEKISPESIRFHLDQLVAAIASSHRQCGEAKGSELMIKPDVIDEDEISSTDLSDEAQMQEECDLASRFKPGLVDDLLLEEQTHHEEGSSEEAENHEQEFDDDLVFGCKPLVDEGSCEEAGVATQAMCRSSTDAREATPSQMVESQAPEGWSLAATHVPRAEDQDHPLQWQGSHSQEVRPPLGKRVYCKRSRSALPRRGARKRTFPWSPRLWKCRKYGITRAEQEVIDGAPLLYTIVLIGLGVLWFWLIPILCKPWNLVPGLRGHGL